MFKRTIKDVENYIENNSEHTARLLQLILQDSCCANCKDCSWRNLCSTNEAG